MVKTWWILALLAAVFVLLGGGLLVGALAADGPLPLLLVGAVFALTGAGLGAAVPAVRRPQRVGGDDEAMRPVAAGDDPGPGDQPWSEEQVAAAIARAFDPTPYVVEHVPGRIRVRADLADARFLTVAGARRVRTVVAHDVVVTGPGRCSTVDRTQDLAWSAGLDGALRPRLTGRGSVFSGEAWGGGSRREWGVAGTAVDWSFGIAELKQPTREVLERAGWERSWSAEAKVGLVVAAIGASAILLVPLAFLVVWLAG